VNAAILVAVWALSGALAAKLLLSWSRMPERAAVHFGWDLQPDGWSSKRTLALFAMILVFGEAALSTWFLLRAGNGAGLAGLVMLAVNLVMVCTFWQVINYNTRGTPIRSRWIVLPLLALLAGAAVIAILQHAR
jgi:Protein of unknown function (DUF1648)